MSKLKHKKQYIFTPYLTLCHPNDLSSIDVNRFELPSSRCNLSSSLYSILQYHVDWLRLCRQFNPKCLPIECLSQDVNFLNAIALVDFNLLNNEENDNISITSSLSSTGKCDLNFIKYYLLNDVLNCIIHPLYELRILFIKIFQNNYQRVLDKNNKMNKISNNEYLQLLNYAVDEIHLFSNSLCNECFISLYPQLTVSSARSVLRDIVYQVVFPHIYNTLIELYNHAYSTENQTLLDSLNLLHNQPIKTAKMLGVVSNCELHVQNGNDTSVLSNQQNGEGTSLHRSQPSVAIVHSVSKRNSISSRSLTSSPYQQELSNNGVTFDAEVNDVSELPTVSSTNGASAPGLSNGSSLRCTCLPTYPKSCVLFLSLSSNITPREKCQTIRQVAHLLVEESRSIRDHSDPTSSSAINSDSNGSSNNDNIASPSKFADADDLLRLFSLLCIECEFNNLPSHLHFLLDFLSIDQANGTIDGYLFTVLQASEKVCTEFAQTIRDKQQKIINQPQSPASAINLFHFAPPTPADMT